MRQGECMSCSQSCMALTSFLRWISNRAWWTLYDGMLHAVKAGTCTNEIQVFSAPNYVDQSGNKGAFVSIGCSIYVTFTMTDNSFCRFELTIWDTESMCNLMPHLIPPWSRWHMCKVALEVFSCKGCIYNVYTLCCIPCLLLVTSVRTSADPNFSIPQARYFPCPIPLIPAFLDG